MKTKGVAAWSHLLLLTKNALLVVVFRKNGFRHCARQNGCAYNRQAKLVDIIWQDKGNL
jgi:hypothetical protein